MVSPDDNYVQNNSLTFSSESNVTCYSGSVAETNVGSFIGVDGGVIHDHVGHPTKGSVSLTLQNTEIQGIYTCQIPDQNKNMRDVNFGVYPIGFNSELYNIIISKFLFPVSQASWLLCMHAHIVGMMPYYRG